MRQVPRSVSSRDKVLSVLRGVQVKRRQLVPLLVSFLAVAVTVKLQIYRHTSESKPLLTIAGISIGMNNHEAFRLLSERHDVHANHHPLQVLRLDGALVLFAVGPSQITWLASRRLEINGNAITRAEDLPESLGTPAVVTHDEFVLCGPGASGQWFPGYNLLICTRESGDVVFSLGAPQGWALLPEGWTWQKVLDMNQPDSW